MFTCKDTKSYAYIQFIVAVNYRLYGYIFGYLFALMIEILRIFASIIT